MKCKSFRKSSILEGLGCVLYINVYIYTWNPNDPCFDCKRPSLGGFKPQNRGQTGSRYIYIYILKCPVLIAIFGSFPVSESFLDIAVNANARRFKQAGGFSRQIWRWSLVVLGQYGPLFPITPKT